MLEQSEQQLGIYTIRKFGDPILNCPTKPVTEDKWDTVVRMADFIQYFIRGSAIGIAAPQVGVQLRFFLGEIPGGIKLFINPHIADFSSTSHISSEGCLSLPGKEFDILRSDWVELAYYDANGEKDSLKVDGLTAELFQHEVDHLDGITVWNHINLTKVRDT